MKNAMKKPLVMLLTLALLLSGGAMSALAAGATAVEDTLIVGINSEPNSLSGILQGVDPNGKVCANLYNKLVKLDPATNEIVPDLAESWEMVDDTTWKFSIRQGVKFHNGATLTAEDCLFSIQQNTYEWMWGAIDRENSYCEDENTLVVKTYEFYPALISMLSSECRIVCKAAWEEMGEDGYSRNPIGTGPYKFVEWVAGDSIMLERFDEYWGEPAYYTNLVYRFIVDDTTRSLSLENGEIDMAQDLPASQVEYLEMSGTVDIVSYPSLSMDYSGFNCQRAPFNDARVRQALRYAIDLDGMVKIAYGSTATPADGICSPTFVDYVPAEGEYVYTQDVEKAKALLAEAGYPDGFNCKHGNRLQVRVLRRRQRIVHPAVGFAADVDEQVALGNLDDVTGSGLVVMQVDAIVQQKGQFNVVYVVAENLAHPIILGKGGADDAERLFALRKGGRKGKYKQAGHQHGNNLFHEYSPH